MLTLLTYASKRGLLNHLQANLLPEQAVKLITPYPAKADALRLAWNKHPKSDVLTLSRFTQDLFKEAGLETTGPMRKSRLLLQLNAFRHMHPAGKNLDYGSFKSAYQIFSDLRAYVDGPELPDEILNQFDESIATMAQLFHQACHATGTLDEHGALFELTALLRKVGEINWQSDAVLVFDGFTFLTPAQLSFLEALAIRQEVIVPLPRQVFADSHALDWPEALKLVAKNVRDTGESETALADLKATYHVGSQMGQALRSWKQQTPDASHIILGGKNISEGSLQEIPFAEIFIKRPIDILAEPRDVVFSRWAKKIRLLTKPLMAKALTQWIAEDRAQIIAAKDFTLSRELAVLQVIEEAIEAIPNALDLQPLDEFLLELLQEVTAMDSPRNSMIPLMKTQQELQVFSLKDLHALPSDGAAALCIDSTLGGLKSDYRPFSPQLEKLLAKLGPVRRPELEFSFLRAELLEVLQRPNLSLLIEEGLLKHDLGWKKIFENIKLIDHQLSEIPKAKFPERDFFSAPVNATAELPYISASRLQDYLDCPRKYHADRIAKIIPRVESTLELDAMAIGDVEHKLLALCWAKGENYWAIEANMQNEATILIDSRTGSKRLSPALKAAAVNEATLYARNGLTRLQQLVKIYPDLKFEFERPLKALDRNGSIDCIGFYREQIFLIDFKRSKGQNPSFKNWEDGYPKVQLWFYLNALKLEGVLKADSKIAVGYLFFKDMENSWIAADTATATMIDTHISKWAESWDDVMGALDRYAQFEIQQIQNLRNERVFAPKPREKEVCTNCSLRPLCPYGGEDEDE
jgi:hypothetical protein